MEAPKASEAEAKSSEKKGETLPQLEYAELFDQARELQVLIKREALAAGPLDEKGWQKAFESFATNSTIQTILKKRGVTGGETLHKFLETEIPFDETALRVPDEQMPALLNALKNTSELSSPRALWRVIRSLPDSTSDQLLKEFVQVATPKIAEDFYRNLTTILPELNECKNAILVATVMARLAPDRAIQALLSPECKGAPFRLSALCEGILHSADPQNFSAKLADPKFVALLLEHFNQSGAAIVKKCSDEAVLQKKENPAAAEPLRLIQGDFNTETFLKDPSLARLSAIKKEWLQMPLAQSVFATNYSKLTQTQLRIMVARNLYTRNIAIGEKSVHAEIERIYETQERYGSVKLFEGRHVVFGANDEKIRDVKNDKGEKYSADTYKMLEEMAKDTSLFGKQQLLAAIKAQAGGKGSLTAFRADEKPDSLKKTKDAFLAQIRTSPYPMTVVFSGHGSPDALCLTGGHRELKDAEAKQQNDTISSKELALAFLDRAKKNPPKDNAVANKDILMLDSCYNGDFVRNFQEALGKKAPSPIIIGSTEVGQYAYSKLANPLEGVFFSTILDLNNAASAPTLKTLMDRTFMGDTKPSIYVQDEDNVQMQLSRKPQKSSNQEIPS